MGQKDNNLLKMINCKCNNNTKNVFLKLHKAFLNKFKENISYDIYPLYITYNELASDKAFAVIYPKRESLDLGLALEKKNCPKHFKDAQHMKYPNISKYTTIKLPKEINTQLLDIIKNAYYNIKTKT